MSSRELKRRLPPNTQKMNPRKRLKLEQSNAQESVETPENPGHDADGPVKLSNLKWKPVDIPENMDDYEGFYGLEEIDGIEVVKDREAAQLSFRLATGNRNRSKGKGAATATANSSAIPTVSRNDKSSVSYEEEWNGFDDGIDDAESPQFGQSKATKQKPKPKAKIANKKASNVTAAAKTSPSMQDGTTLDSAGFSILADHDDDSADADISAWRSLDLSDEVLSSLSKMGFSQPTEIQASTIPQIREGNDLIGKAPTGSGKTLAFGIPIVEDWIERRRETNKLKTRNTEKQPCALIVLPTRELAHQITSHIQSLIRHAALDDMKVTAITGGLSIHKQRRVLTQADIIVGTPGRLWEVITEGQGVLESLKHIKFLVVDEADRLLSEGHFKELEEIINALDKEVTDDAESNNAVPRPSKNIDRGKSRRQTLVFSATFSKSLHQKLSGRRGFQASQLIHDKSDTMEYLLRKLNFHSADPAFIDVNPVQQMATNLREGVVECPSGTEKDLYLYTLLLYHHPGARALVFVNSISAVKRLVPLLGNLGLVAFPLHSHMPQKARLRSVERFSSLTSDTKQPPSGKKDASVPKAASSSQMHDTKILVATDVAARGLDIPNITLVLHYHLPRTADGYVHRSGRTARASNAGSSVLLCAPEEVAGVRRLVAQVHADAASVFKQGHQQADAKTSSTKRGKFYMQTLYPDMRLVSELKPRVALAKKVADSVIVKDKKRKEEDFFRAAAEELGVSSASDDFPEEDKQGKSRARKNVPKDSRNDEKGKGAQKRMESLSVTQEQMKAMRAELKVLLGKKINLGVSEKYLVSKGGEEVARLLREREMGSANGYSARFDAVGVLGNVAPLGWET